MQHLDKLKKNWRTLIYYGLWIGIFSYFLLQNYPIWRQHSKMEGKKIHAVTVFNLQQKQVAVPTDLKKPAVLIFWATWCPPCKVELERFRNAVDKKELNAEQIYAISIGEHLAQVQSFAQEKKFPFKLYADPQYQSAQQFNIAATPTVAHIAAGGVISWITSGVSPMGIYKAIKHLEPLSPPPEKKP